MHDVALKLLLKLGEYETKAREWSKIPDDQQTCTAWENTFREAYGAKRRAETAREGEDKPFGGSAANEAHNQLRRRGNTASSVPVPLPNQILDSLEGSLDNIAAAATQTVAKGGPLA